MRNDHLKAAVMGAWVLAVGTLGFVSGAESFGALAALVVLSVVPPAVMVRLWSTPDPSMSETIRDVLR